MDIQLTEQIIRERANEQSFQKGLAYYKTGAVYNASAQSTPGGVALTANCEGSSAPSYRLRAELDAGGVRNASCTCPYDWGGDCKHLVALLLLYLHQPDKFAEQKSVVGLLSGLEKETLVAVITRLIEQNPDLYDELELAIPAARVISQPKSSPKEKRQTQVSEATYRKQISRIFKQSRYDEGDYYNDYGGTPAYVEELEKVRQTAVQFLEAGDAEGALIILRVLLEETTEDYDGEMDYNGDLACVIQDIGLPLAEAILSAELDDETRTSLQESVQEIYDNLDETIESSELIVILDALKYGWRELANAEIENRDAEVHDENDEDYDDEEDYDEEDWHSFYDLQRARLNVLERQGQIDEFLLRAKTVDVSRFALKLLELGRVDEAVTASQNLVLDREILTVAQKLREAGRLDEAIALAERGLALNSNHRHEIATWLAPLEETQGRKEMALQAYRVAFEAQPAIALYRHLKRLSGAEWEKLRPQLVKKAGEGYERGTLVDIHLEEKEWDAAISVAERDTWSTSLLEKVAEKLITVRPDWVIRVSLKQSDALIVKTESKLYPQAAKWLARAKKAYQHKGQMSDWQAYITNLRTTYARRPALQKALAGL